MTVREIFWRVTLAWAAILLAGTNLAYAITQDADMAWVLRLFFLILAGVNVFSAWMLLQLPKKAA